jgi:hypothetical protein
MLAEIPCIQCYGCQQCYTLFDQTTSDRWATRTETEGRWFPCLDAFSVEIHSASFKLKENYETQRDKIYYLDFFLGEYFFAIHEYTPLDILYIL